METLQSFPPKDICKVKELFQGAKQTTNTVQNQTLLPMCIKMTRHHVKCFVISVSHQPKTKLQFLCVSPTGVLAGPLGRLKWKLHRSRDALQVGGFEPLLQ